MRFRNSGAAAVANVAIPRLEEFPEVLKAREARATVAAELSKARAVVTTLEAELGDPKRPRSELRVRLDIEEAQVVVSDRQVAFNEATAAVCAIEDRFERP